MGKLTNAKLKGLSERRGRFGDGQGLFFRSLGESKCYWVYRYRVGGRERELSLGPWPELGLIEARLKHAEQRKRVVVDHADPLAEKRAAKAVAAASPKTAKPTFGEIADQYLDDHEAKWTNPVHRAQWRRTLGSPCAAIRDMAVDEIDTAAVLKVLKPIWHETPETASRLRARIEAVIASAQVDGWIDETRPNPARWKNWLDKKLPNPREIGERGHHAAMDYRDLPAFMLKLKAAPGTAAKALMFAILTMARSGEVFGMTFDELGLDPPTNGSAAAWAGPTWTVPAARMKMGREHPVPLSPALVGILKGQLAERGPRGVFVFESPIAQGATIHRNAAHQPLSNMAFNMLLRRMGASDITTHGFRSSARSWMADTGVPFEVAEACLAHAPGNAVVQAYQRSNMLERRRPVMADWAAFVMGGDEAAKKAAPLSVAKRKSKR
jgi:integrase